MEDIHLIDPLSAKNKKFIPPWHNQLITAEEILVYPVIVKKKVIGLFYADWDIRRKDLNEKSMEYMKILRNQAALAIKQKS